MSRLIAPAHRLRFDLTPAGVTSLADDLKQMVKKTYAKVVSVDDSARTFDNTIQPLADCEADYDTLSSNCDFPMYVSPDSELRKVSTETDKKLQAFGVECQMRVDVYRAVGAYALKKESLLDEQQRFLDRLLLDFKRNGLHLEEDVRDKVKGLKSRLSELCVEFSSNLNEDTTHRFFSAEDLDGLPADYFTDREKNDQGLFKVTTKYPDVLPLLRHAKNEKTRQEMDLANGSRCQENIQVLDEVLQIRKELASLLGYETHAEFVLEKRMAKTVDAVRSFLSDLQEKLTPHAKKELERLRELKAKLAGVPLTDDVIVYGYDFQFLHNHLLQTEYEVDSQKIKQYFPVDHVTKVVLEIYQDLLDLSFRKVESATLWHEDVELYEVFNWDGGFVGHFLLDLFPREGKYGHAAAFPLQRGCVVSDGRRQHPVSAMVANFSKPTSAKPSLLDHNELVTFFHELGHVFHGLCAKADYSRFSGTSVERDFVEAPSQMLESWAWDAKVLKRLSRHHESGEALPDDLIERMIKAKNVNAGLLTLRQIFFALFDITIHTSKEKIDTTSLWFKLRKDISLLEQQPGTFPAATFGHIVGGYDAGYYGYLWADVFAQDMFEVFRSSPNGCLDQVVGRRYRRFILQPGGTIDATRMLRSFLGRDPDTSSFLKSLGLQ